MAVSPLVFPSGSAEQNLSAKKTKTVLRPKVQASEANNGTNDLAEQMNEVEKQKYVKGLIYHQLIHNPQS